ncbi:unnamed protein product [Medioppia subpectinata]|uniref:Homologous-pairing protein 2 homolog n=1 Tax=Medioppia subpectinata TaxID=1979941 RepID=A0A7R9KEP6_9ACAR|nr:unnamed protein product [Medioppia subpectinata]CAG2101962.1 unnamed protein product [Medioppia subpectinata]
MSKTKDPLVSLVKSYLSKTNRPFSGNDVFNNMNSKDSKLSKTAVFKALEDLSAKEKIIEKLNGKQKIYFPLQDNFEAVDDQQLKQLDQQLDQLGKEFNQVDDEHKHKASKLSAIKSGQTLAQISEQLSELKAQTSEMEERMKCIDSKAKGLDPKANHKLKNERQKLVTDWRKRKRMATNMVDMILESYPKPKKAFIEEIGLETDEQLKVDLPQM